jgi:hypothetical protein
LRRKGAPIFAAIRVGGQWAVIGCSFPPCPPSPFWGLLPRAQGRPCPPCRRARYCHPGGARRCTSGARRLFILGAISRWSCHVRQHRTALIYNRIWQGTQPSPSFPCVWRAVRAGLLFTARPQRALFDARRVTPAGPLWPQRALRRPVVLASRDKLANRASMRAARVRGDRRLRTPRRWWW